MDAGLAKVLNSTVGTNSMKSLDQVLDGVIENVLTRNKIFVESDESYYTFPLKLQHWSGTGIQTEKSLITFTMPYGGSANLKFHAGPQTNGNTCWLYIYVNNVLHKTVILNDTYMGGVPTSFKNERFSFSKGDVVDIRVRLSVNTNYAYVYLDSIRASIVSGTLPPTVTLKV